MSKKEKMILIGFAIKKARNQKNKTQTELSKEIGLSRTYLSDLENGRYMPSTEALFRIASSLEIDLNSFI